MDSEEITFRQWFVVPHETIHRLNAYKSLLIGWNEKFNLIAESTVSHIWLRHFADSAQLMAFIPENARTLADMGSGAGFPGLVLAIMRPELSVTLIESIGKKADFLRAVKAELGLGNVEVRQERIEALKGLKADIVTARALKALSELLKYAHRLMHKDSLALFLKGKSLPEELTEARKYWTFDAETSQSRTDESGRILALGNLRYKTRR